jgi:hypothetical protein
MAIYIRLFRMPIFPYSKYRHIRVENKFNYSLIATPRDVKDTPWLPLAPIMIVSMTGRFAFAGELHFTMKFAPMQQLKIVQNNYLFRKYCKYYFSSSY